MPISFECSECGHQIEAPEAAAGKRGKCPHCGHSNDIPAAAPEIDANLFDLAPLDADEERRREQTERNLLAQEHDLISEMSGDGGARLEQRDDVDVEDLYHLIINYCHDMVDGQLERARTHVDKMKRFRSLSREGVERFLSGQTSDEALAHIPRPLLEGFLKDLCDSLA